MQKLLAASVIFILISNSSFAQYSYWKSVEKRNSVSSITLGYKYRDASYVDIGYSHAFQILDTNWDYRPEATFGYSADNMTANIVNAIYIPWNDSQKLFMLNFGITNNLNFPSDTSKMAWGVEPYVGIDFMYLATLRVGYNYFVLDDSPLLKNSLMASVQVHMPIGVLFRRKD